MENPAVRNSLLLTNGSQSTIRNAISSKRGGNCGCRVYPYPTGQPYFHLPTFTVVIKYLYGPPFDLKAVYLGKV